MYLSRWVRSNVKFSIQCAINSLAFRKKCYPVEIMFIMGEAHPWLCSVANGFFHCKIELETRILRVQTPYIPRRVVFKVWGAGDHLLWGGGGGERANLAVLSLWLFRTVRLLHLSVLSHCWAESCLWISSRWKVPFSCWSWLHMLDPSLEVCRSWYYTVGSCNPVILSSMSFKCIRDHIISRYNSFQDISVRGRGAGGAAAPPVGKKIVLFGQRHSKKYFII